MERRSVAEMALDSRPTSVLRDRSVDLQSANVMRKSAIVLSSCTRSLIETASVGSWRQWYTVYLPGWNQDCC